MEYDNFKLQCVPKSLAFTCKKIGQADRARIKGHPVFLCIFSGEELDHHLPAADGDHGSLLGGGESRETLHTVLLTIIDLYISSFLFLISFFSSLPFTIML